MQPDTEGRFCGSCQKTVVDFTTMSDPEILAWFASARGPVCGRFINSQLDRDLVPARMPKKRVWAVLWQFLLAGLLVSSEASAREKPARPPMGQMVNHDVPLTDTGRVTFQVVDTKTGQPVQGSVAYINKKHFESDSAGRFSIDRDDLQKGNKIKILAIGYQTLTWKTKKKMFEGNEQVVRLSLDETISGDVILVGAVEER